MNHDDLIVRDARYVADAIKIRYTPFVAASGDGAYLFDDAGKRFIDFGAGWAAAGLGYSNEHVKQAVAAQMNKATMAGLLSSINRPAVELAERLVNLVPGEIEKKTWFGLAGSDAAEAAQRMILRATGKPRIISFVGGWHGTTDAMMAMSAHPSLGGTLGGAHVTKIPYPNPYRDPFGGDGTELADRCLGYLEKLTCSRPSARPSRWRPFSSRPFKAMEAISSPRTISCRSCGRFAIDMKSIWWSMKSRSGSVAPVSGSRSNTAASSPILC